MDGNVGVGKSTLLELCREMIDESGLQSKVCIVPEPVDVWERFLASAPQGRRDHSALELYYMNPQRLSYPFQLFVLTTLLSAFDKAILNHQNMYGEEPALVICERYQNWAARSTFVQDFIDRDIWTMDEHDFYVTTWNYMIESAGYPTPVHWYVVCTPQTSHARIAARNRGGENLLSLESLRRLDTLFHAWSRSLDTDDRVIHTEMDYRLPRNRLWYSAWVGKEILFHILAEPHTLTEHQIVHFTDMYSLASDMCLNLTPDLL